MNCYKCHKLAEVKFPNGDLCKTCFLDILYKRVKKEVRANCPFKKNEKVLTYGKLTKHFLLRSIENLPIELIEARERFALKDFNKKLKYDKIVLPWTADDEAVMFFNKITSIKPSYDNLGQGRFVKLFKTVTKNELEQASTLLKIPQYFITKDENIEKIHKKYHHALLGLVKSAEEFKKAAN